jgi:hypothetical protein
MRDLPNSVRNHLIARSTQKSVSADIDGRDARKARVAVLAKATREERLAHKKRSAALARAWGLEAVLASIADEREAAVEAIRLALREVEAKHPGITSRVLRITRAALAAVEAVAVQGLAQDAAATRNKRNTTRRLGEGNRKPVSDKDLCDLMRGLRDGARAYSREAAAKVVAKQVLQTKKLAISASTVKRRTASVRW